MPEVQAGTDLVEIERFARSLHEHGNALKSRLFTHDELSYCEKQHRPEASLAARFAAKEALRKIFGQWGYTDVAWQETEVGMEGSGAPQVILHGKAAQRAAGYGFSLSLSHTEHYALALCVAWQRES